MNGSTMAAVGLIKVQELGLGGIFPMGEGGRANKCWTPLSTVRAGGLMNRSLFTYWALLFCICHLVLEDKADWNCDPPW